jgi:hypothetical protein
VIDALVDGQAQAIGLDQDVVVRRRNVDATGFDRLLVDDLGDAQRAAALQERRQHVLVIGGAMQSDHDRQCKSRGQ